MDRITKGLIDTFQKSYEINDRDETKVFEHFVNYSVVNNELGNTEFDVDDIATGKATQGIDGIAIIVNQKLVQNISDIDLLIEHNQTLSVKFVIIQSKTSSAFDNAEIGNLFTFTNLYFADDTSIFKTDEMQKFIELKEYIFSKVSKLKSNPQLVLYYVCLGTWCNDENLRAAITLGTNSLNNTNLFADVKFYPFGSSEIQDYYRKTKSKLSATFKFEKRITMYSTSDDEVGYSGVLPFSEYKKLILTDGGSPKPVFEDNIRDFLGPNTDVNSSITETLQSGNINAFSMLNNGVIIVASTISIHGDNATIEDYQIVNGCQTSNILISNKDLVPNLDSLIIPIRIIATKDETLKSEITRATNSQTAIKKEQLEALSTFQKKLEEYYKTYKDDDSLVYERRTGQYRLSDFPKSRIISIPTQIKAVAAMFLGVPSAVSGQYGTVVNRVGDQIFNSNDQLIMYYVSAFALYRIEGLFRTNTIDKKFRRSRYHAMMLFRIVCSDKKVPQYNSKAMDAYCQHLLGILNDENKYKPLFSLIVDFIVSKSHEIGFEDRKCFEKKETTTYLENSLCELNEYLRLMGGWS